MVVVVVAHLRPFRAGQASREATTTVVEVVVVAVVVVVVVVVRVW